MVGFLQNKNEVVIKNEARKLFLNGVSVDKIRENLNKLFSAKVTKKDIIVWKETDDWDRELTHIKESEKTNKAVVVKMPEFEVVRQTQYEKLLEYQREIDSEIRRLKDEKKPLNARLITAGVEVSKQIIKVAGIEILGTGKNEITNILINFSKDEAKKDEIIDAESVE